MKTAVICFLLVNFVLGLAANDLADIQYRFTSCGAVGRNGPSISQCTRWYMQQNSPIIRNGGLLSFISDGSKIFRGSQGFRIPKSGLYNVTVAGAAGGRGICSIQQGRGLLWKGTVELFDSQEILVSVGQKGGEPCEIMKEIPVCANPPANVNDSFKCFEDWDNWLASRTQLSQNAISTTKNYGGGGSGGGASMLRLHNPKTGVFSTFPVVVAGGGGGSAAKFLPDILSTINIASPLDLNKSYTSFIDAKSTDRDATLADVHNFTGIRGYIDNSVNIFNNRPGAGGGYSPAISLQQDGSPLSVSEDFALGGFDCLHLSTDLSQRPLLETVHGGFGGGGGQCESGGSGGGYTGGSVFSNSYFGIPGNGGFYSYFSQPLNDVSELSVELNTKLNGFVEIVLSECGCEYKCIIDEDHQTFECLCPINTTLAPNKLDCFEGLSIDLTEYIWKDYVIQDLLISYIPFSAPIGIFSVYSMVVLSGGLDYERSASYSQPMCTLMFINDTGAVLLATNVIRTLSGEFNQLSPVVELKFEHMLDNPIRVVGAVLAGNRNCSVGVDMLELNISLNSRNYEAVTNVMLDLNNMVKVARTLLGTASLDESLPTFGTSIKPDSSIDGGYVLLLSVAGVLVIVVIVTLLGSIYCCCRKRKKKVPKAPISNVYTTIEENSMVQNLLYNRHTASVSTMLRSEDLDITNGEDLTASIRSFTPKFGITVPDYSFMSYNTQREENLWEYSRSGLIYMKELGEGQFGKVLLMKAHSIAGFTGSLPVAVKTLSSTDPMIVKKFSEEANLMKKFLHPNIISLLGISLEDVDQDNAPLLILEYMPYGDLNNFLRKYSPDAVQANCRQGVEVQHFYSFARDVANGLDFLSSRNYIHGDMASRNCLVGPSLNVKISDFGLTKKLDSGADMFKLEGSAVLPLRWLSPESIMFGQFSLASDIWSYGVLLWEIVTYGETPLGNMSSEEIINMAETRNLQHSRPDGPEDIYNIMKSCHQHLPQSRINIVDIKRMLHQCTS